MMKFYIVGDVARKKVTVFINKSNAEEFYKKEDCNAFVEQSLPITKYGITKAIEFGALINNGFPIKTADRKIYPNEHTDEV